MKAWTNAIINRTGAPVNCWLLCMSYVCYLLNPISCASLKGQISLTKLNGVTPDISIIMMYTFYHSVYYASHSQSFSSIVRKNMHFVLELLLLNIIFYGLGQHVGDAITHKLLDSSSNNILHRAAVCPADDIYPNKHLLTDLGSQWDPTNPIPSHLLNPVRILTNLSVNPWLNIIQMTS